jgi:hypothetical protein
VAIVQEKVAFRQFVLPNLFFEQVLIWAGPLKS